MQVALSTAASGGKEQNEALQALGLTYKDLAALKPDQQFELLGDQIAKLPNSADKARAAVALFGRAGADLLPLFNEGAEGIERARAEAERFGESFSTEQLTKLEEANDSITKLTSSFKAMATMLTAEVAPGLTQLFTNITAVVTGDKLGKLQQQLDFLTANQGKWLVGVGSGVQSGLLSPEDVQRQITALTSQQTDQMLLAHAPPDFLSDIKPSSYEDVDRKQKLLDLAKKYKDETAIRLQGADAYQATLDKIKLAQDQGVIDEEDASKRKIAAWRAYVDYVSKQAADDYKLALIRDQQAKLPDLTAVANHQIKASSYFQDLIDPQQLESTRGQTQDFFKDIETDSDQSIKKISKILDDSLGHWSLPAEVFDSSMKTALDHMIETGEFSARDLVSDMIKEFERQELFAAIDKISEALDDALSDHAVAAKSGGGWLGKILDLVGGFAGSLFGSSSINSVSRSTDRLINSQLGTVSPLIPHATGGPVSAGSAYLVGERGEELFVPRTGGQIIPNDQLAALIGSGGTSLTGSAASINYSPVVTINGSNTVTPRDLQLALAQHGREFVHYIETQRKYGKLLPNAV